MSEARNAESPLPCKKRYGSEHWLEAVEVKAAESPVVQGFFSRQDVARQYYHRTCTQVGVAILIGTNFLANILQKEIDPDDDQYPVFFAFLEDFFNILFLSELLLNMYGHWWYQFWRDAWNWFDFVVVSIGIILMMRLPLPSAFNLLRTMRAFRVFRLFKRVKSLNKIVVAIFLSIPGVANAFLILAIVVAIYAILGVEFFKDVGEGCQTPPKYRDPGTCIGREYFGTFSKALFSFFQVMTGDSWAEAIARPVIWSFSPVKTAGSAFYFVSFVVVTSMVLVNVVVAVLLDKMVDPEIDIEGIDNGEEEEDEFADAEVRPSDTHCMDPVPSAHGDSVGGNHRHPAHSPGHSNTLHSRINDIEKGLRDVRRALVETHYDMANDRTLLLRILKAVEGGALEQPVAVPPVPPMVPPDNNGLVHPLITADRKLSLTL